MHALKINDSGGFIENDSVSHSDSVSQTLTQHSLRAQHVLGVGNKTVHKACPRGADLLLIPELSSEK